MAQRWMIQRCTLAAKPVITATQILESMVGKPRPNRSEASDVSNAVLDGSDAILLSGATSIGEYPVNAVSMAAKICCEAEKMLVSRNLYDVNLAATPKPVNSAEAVAINAASAALNLSMDMIIVLTETGRLA